MIFHLTGRGACREEKRVYRGANCIIAFALKLGISDATFYKWRAKFGGMDVSDAKRLKELEGENAKLKKLLAEAHLDMHALKSVLGVKR